MVAVVKQFKKILTRNNLLLLLLIILIVVVVVVYKLKLEKFDNGSSSGRAVIVSYYYMPGCGWCKKFNPEWDKFQAAADPSVIQPQKIDATTPDGQKAASDAGVSGYPTVIIQASGKNPVTYSGERTSAALNDYVANLM
jgi:hypothetical protein